MGWGRSSYTARPTASFMGVTFEEIRHTDLDQKALEFFGTRVAAVVRQADERLFQLLFGAKSIW